MPELARRDEARTGLYHLWNSVTGMGTVACPGRPGRRCERLPDRYLGEPTIAALVPQRERCGGYAVWPLDVPRKWEGPLPDDWPGEKIPRWYVWWRLFELQHGRCACCLASPNTIDHDHRSGAVRGLLCASCNRLETDYFRRLRMCVHPPPHCFEDYWRYPPALRFRWIMSSPNSFRHELWRRGR